jgi:AraC family transcriptional regulator
MKPTTVAPEKYATLMPRRPDLSSLGRDWKRLQVLRVHHPPKWRLELPPLDSHYIGVHMSGPCRMASRWQGPTQHRRWIPGEVMIMSAQQESTWEWNGNLDELQMLLDPQALAQAAAEVTDQPVHLADGLGILDPIISEIAFRTTVELGDPNSSSSLFGDCAATALITRLLQNYSTLRHPERLQRLDISPHRLRTALEYIDTHLDEDLKLEDIAAVVKMSPYHFARGFRKAMGRPPHQHLLTLRMDRARDLLRNTSEEISTIAARVGFSSQSHFSYVFRNQSGMTPTHYRQLSAA